jgi:flagellar biosynthetic protein FliP
MTFKQGGACLRRYAPAFAGVCLLLAAGFVTSSAHAAPQNPDLLPGIIPGTGSGLTVKSQILVLMTILGLLPVMVMMMTSFTRFVIVLSLLRQALGLQSGLPNRIVTGVALILTLLVMRPVGEQVWNEAFVPYDKDKITLEQALKTAEVPLSRFVLSELKSAFQIGCMLFIPFLIIDLVVSSVLMAMGMMMLSPLVISLPFKLLLFVLVDGWTLTVNTLVGSIHGY